MLVFTPEKTELSIYRLDFNADLLGSIKEIVEREDVGAGAFWVIGAVSKAKFSFYDQSSKKYLEVSMNEPLEVASCIGNVAEMEGRKVIHAHVVFSNRKGEAFGGHLLEGTTIFSAELVLLKFKDIKLRRSFDSVTGLNLLSP